MTYTRIGLTIGLVLAFAIILGGLSGFLLDVILGALGLLLGLHLDGKIDLRALSDTIRRSGRG